MGAQDAFEQIYFLTDFSLFLKFSYDIVKPRPYRSVLLDCRGPGSVGESLSARLLTESPGNSQDYSARLLAELSTAIRIGIRLIGIDEP